MILFIISEIYMQITKNFTDGYVCMEPPPRQKFYFHVNYTFSFKKKP